MHQIGETYRNAKIELIFEAQNSLLWIGTSEGLFSYDGLEFVPFLKSDSTSNHVRSVFQNEKGVLWVGYHDGTVWYLEKQQLNKWEPEEGTPSVPIMGFAEDHNGNFWLASYGEGIYYKSENHLYNINTDDGLLGDDIYVMKTDKLGRIWVGTDGGISICEIRNKEKIINNLTRDDGLPDEIVREILEDDDGDFWIGTYDKGVCFYDFEKEKFEYPLSNWDNGIVSKLEIFKDRELWIGTEGNGVWLLSLLDGTLQKLSNQNQLSGSKIHDLHKDIEGNIWVISNLHGICHANRQFEFIPITTGADFENIQSILADRENKVWVGTEKGLFTHELDELGNSFFTQHLKNQSLNVISLYEDNFENIWIGTFGDGVYIFNKRTLKIRRLTEKDGLSNGSILSMNGVNDKIWLATLGGVTELQLNGDPLENGSLSTRNLNQEDGLGTNFIYKVFVDSKARVWFATDGKGISVLENGSIKNFQKAAHYHEDEPGSEEVLLKAVYSITEDQQGHIWLSTAKEGIFEFDGKEFKHLTVKEGIRDLAITSLITDKKGNILIVHPTGLDILKPETRHLIYYDKAVGIEDIDPNLNAVCKDRNDNIWIGCKNGIIKYLPLNESLEIHPRTRLSNVSIFLEPIDFHSDTTFLYDQNNLVFDYLGLWYTDPSTVKYRYQLVGYDRDWIFSKDRKVTYSNLDPGTYSFNVASTENDAWLDEPIISYSFEVLPPLWQRWWFILLVLLSAGGIFYWYQKARDKRIQRVNLLEKEKAESNLAALKAQINPHFLFNSFNTLVTVIDEDPKTAVEYVEKMSDFYRTMLEYRDKDVIPLAEELALVKNYTYLLERRFGENFRVNLNMNGEQIYLAPLTLQILLENAVKHNIISKAKPLTVSIGMNGSDYLVIENNLQPKIRPEKSTQFGLQSLIKRYELLTGKKMKIEETEDRFRVEVPVVK
jgi:ligand-binding sensor domain-containing protein